MQKVKITFWQTARRLFTSPAAEAKQKAAKHVEHIRQVMKEHGQESNSSPKSNGWEVLWQKGLTPWDLGGPTKALISEVQAKNLSPLTTLIPGCGTGYDLESLGRYLDRQQVQLKQHAPTSPDGQRMCKIIGLEISDTSLKRAQENLELSLKERGPLQTIEITLCRGDFFASPSTWDTVYQTPTKCKSHDEHLTGVPLHFDFIFDYTFFCALPPELRAPWGRQIAQLLSSANGTSHGGKLLTLMFPYTTRQKAIAAADKGPPYLVSLNCYQDVLHAHNLYLDTPEPYISEATAVGRQGQEVVGWWSPKSQSSILSPSKL